MKVTEFITKIAVATVALGFLLMIAGWAFSANFAENTQALQAFFQ